MKVTKVSACVDCGTPMIGDHLRFPMCRDIHAASTLALAPDDVSTQPIPRQRVRVQNRVDRDFAQWIRVIEVMAIVAIAFALCVKGCS